MDLSAFFRGDLAGAPDNALPELLRAILVRTHFSAQTRQALGWRGLRRSGGRPEGWTARIHKTAGVYGLGFQGLAPAPGWVLGRFGLYYFPEPSEPLVERCALAAAALTQRADYWQRVGAFPDGEPFSRHFEIGALALGVDAAGGSLALRLDCLSVLRTISRQGVRLPRDGRMVPLIPPGGVDRDLPAREIALPFFDTLAASVTFNLGAGPVFLSEHRCPAGQQDAERAEGSSDAADGEVWRSVLLLGYGKEPGRSMEAGTVPAAQEALQTLTWRSGEALPQVHADRLWWGERKTSVPAPIGTGPPAIDRRPPLILLTGFLGAGKTSFLQHFIEYQHQRNRLVAVIQNEIGAIGLDGRLLDAVVSEVDEGCICCTLAGNLKRTLQAIQERHAPDFIVLETTGLANPRNLLDELQAVSDRVRFDITLAVVDALNFPASLEASAVAAEQVAAADLILLNKTDLVREAQAEGVRRALRALNPRAPLRATRDGDLNPALIFEAAGQTQAMEPDDAPGAVQPGVRGATHAADRFGAHSIRLPRPLQRPGLLAALAAFPAAIFRAKGIVDLDDPPQPHLLQYVAGRYALSPLPAPRTTERFVTVIGPMAGTRTASQTEALLHSAMRREG